MASELIKYTDVEIHQAEQIVLTDVNLTVQAGEMIYLLGKVGSGKSSLMKTIYGALPIAAGSAEVLGQDMAKIRRRQLPYLRRRLGIVFQDYKLLTDRSVEDNLRFVLKATGWKDKTLMKAHVKEVLEQVGMEKKAYEGGLAPLWNLESPSSPPCQPIQIEQILPINEYNAYFDGFIQQLESAVQYAKFYDEPEKLCPYNDENIRKIMMSLFGKRVDG